MVCKTLSSWKKSLWVSEPTRLRTWTSKLLTCKEKKSSWLWNKRLQKDNSNWQRSKKRRRLQVFRRWLLGRKRRERCGSIGTRRSSKSIQSPINSYCRSRVTWRTRPWQLKTPRSNCKLSTDKLRLWLSSSRNAKNSTMRVKQNKKMLNASFIRKKR